METIVALDDGGSARLEFIKQFGDQPKICAATGSSRIFAHFNSGELSQTFSSTGALSQAFSSTG